MRAVVQRVLWARVEVEGQVVGEIGPGLLALVAVGREDGPDDRAYVADKLLHLRVFPDEEGKMNRSLLDVGGQLLVVSQFTLYGDVRRGRRPSYIEAAAPAEGREGYEAFLHDLEARGVHPQTGIFQADMQVSLCNDGPVTILIDSRRTF